MTSMSVFAKGLSLLKRLDSFLIPLRGGSYLLPWIWPTASSQNAIQSHDQGFRGEVTKRQFESLLKGFLGDVGLKPLESQKAAPSLEIAIFERIDPVTPNKPLAKAATKIGTLVTIYFYPNHNEQSQFLIGLFTACFLVVEDDGHLMVDDLAQFRPRMMAGHKQPELFELMKWLFAEFDGAFPRFCSNKLFASILSAWSVFEVEYDQSPSPTVTSTASPLFPKYFRNMTGCSEVYVYFLLTQEDFSMTRMKLLLRAIPELLNVTDELNDLFSFYKESVIDIDRDSAIERDTYVYQQACVDGAPVWNVIQSVAEKIKQRYATIESILQDDPFLQELGREFMIGQMQFYLTSKRYRLSELDLTP